MERIPREQVLRRLQVENPWWAPDGQVQEVFRDWGPRPYLDLFFPLVTSTVRRAVVLMGPRRVGKTVMIHHAVQRLIESGVDPLRIGYFSVAHPLYDGLALEEFVDLFREATGTDLGGGPVYLFFDEIQYLRKWEVHLKALVDTYPALRATASGSAAAALRLKSLESGAGRFTDFLLPPLAFYEYLKLLGEEDLFVRESGVFFHARDPEAANRSFLHYLNFGGYPEVVLSREIQDDPGRFVKGDIVDKVLLRDLPSLYGIQDIQELNSLFTRLAYNTAGELSLDELSKGSGVAKNTIKKYVEYLEATFLIRVLHRVDQRAGRFQRASAFKVYLTSPSIRSALFSIVEDGDPALGALVETAVFSQWIHSHERLHYARWRDGEVDLVQVDGHGGVAWAVEVKWSDRIVDRSDELRAALRFCADNRAGRFVVTTRTRTERQRLSDVAVEFYPAADFCYTVGRNLIERRVTLPADG